jgi:hypothetical protein
MNEMMIKLEHGLFDPETQVMFCVLVWVHLEFDTGW